MKKMKIVLTALAVSISGTLAQAEYKQKLSCKFKESPASSYSQVRDEFLINVADGSPKNPVWLLTGIFGPSSAFPVFCGSKDIFKDCLVSNGEFKLIGKPKFSVVDDVALIQSAVFSLKGKMKEDARGEIANLAERSAKEGYTSESLASMQEEIGQIVSRVESTSHDTELLCTVTGLFK